MRFERTATRAAAAVYGSIIALAVILVSAKGNVEAYQVLFAVLGAVIATALAESYADYIADVIRERRHPTWPEVRVSLADALAGALAALVPAAPFLLVELGAIDLDTAYDVAAWLGLAVIGSYTMLANRLAGLAWRRNALVTAVALAVGLTLIAIKALTH